PAAGESQVPTNVQLQVLFDKTISLVNTSRISLKQGSTIMPITVSQNQAVGYSSISVTPSALLSLNTSYTLTVAVQDIAGIWMKPVAIPFTTGPGADLSFPSVVAQNPAPYALNVPVNVDPSITLNVPFNAVTATTFSLAQYYCGNTPLPATVALS